MRGVQPWFDPAVFGWIPGVIIAILGAVFGLGVGAARRQPGAAGAMARMLGAWAYWLAVVLALVFLAVGAVGAASGQPDGVWLSLVLPGLIGLVGMLVMLPVFLRLTR